MATTFLLAFAPPALAQSRPDGDLLGTETTYTVAAGDNLSAIARKTQVGLTELLAANPSVTSATIHPGITLTIPGRHMLPMGTRTGIVVNLAELRLYRFMGDGRVFSAPISVGREGWDTPAGTTRVVQKRANPVWTVPASIRAENPKLPDKMQPGPENPLGKYAMNLGWPGYLIHGTNNPASVGKPSSHGCIRLYPEDIAALFAATPVGETVTVVDSPITLGQQNGALYIQVTPTRQQATQIVSFAQAPALTEADPAVQALKQRLDQLTAQGAQVDENAVDAAISRHDGIPVAIGKMPVAQTAQAAPQPQAQPKSWLDQASDMAHDAWTMLGGN
ncbi:L,D-transpeptidase family protein [Asticcacaulis solisilvae]|uniref:L,D-transpeptidase family protein n=1 Tax=Asticcacaulis solisilvae TaxID=1217274 RepID=UPI003FD7E60D